jgi:hypothetical protein
MDMVLQTTGALMSTNDTVGQQYTDHAVTRARNLLERNYDIYAGRDGLKPIRSVGGLPVRAANEQQGHRTALWTPGSRWPTTRLHQPLHPSPLPLSILCPASAMATQSSHMLVFDCSRRWTSCWWTPVPP